ncbi:MAG: hypothetical protein LBJ35_05835 [Spirochaetaceae bacterium]|nr:hypothetical protein [Spirochaetaceae bacterium]
MTGAAAPDQMTVNEAFSADGGLKKDGKTLPKPNPAEVTVNTVVYKFWKWDDMAEGGNSISDATALYPAEGGSSITLYAQWQQKDNPSVSLNYNGAGYGKPGTPQTWTAPKDGIYKIEVWGAGRSETGNGRGGYIGGNIQLSEGDKLYIYCGGQGVELGNNMDAAGGWNGGGSNGGKAASGNSGGGGHGATDIRTTGGDWNNAQSLASRILVAGGGGGGAYGRNPQNTNNGGYSVAGNGGYGKKSGGDGAAFVNTSIVAKGGGESADATATGGGNAGAPGAGGKGGLLATASTRGGGGGGGGYYGGAGGGIAAGGNACAGGGGSSWAKTSGEASDLKFIETSIVPNSDAAKEGGGAWTNAGKAVITFVSDIPS